MTKCPICARMVASLVYEKPMDDRHIFFVRALKPEWDVQYGICPDCIDGFNEQEISDEDYELFKKEVYLNIAIRMTPEQRAGFNKIVNTLRENESNQGCGERMGLMIVFLVMLCPSGMVLWRFAANILLPL